MADHKQLLHDLLKENQEPFKLKSYISEKRSQLKKIPPTTTLQVKKRSYLSKNACFFSFRNSPDVRKSPVVSFSSKAMSPCKSPAGDVFLHVPSRTAAVLVEAAMRIQKQQKQKPKSQGKGLFGSFLKRLKDRSKNKKRAIGDNEFKVLRNYEPKEKENLDWNSSRLCRNDLDASTSSCRPEELDGVNGDFTFVETQFCSSPLSSFSFSLHRSPSSSSRRTPDLFSPAASPRRHVKQEKEGDLDSVRGEEEKEQCSPVSVLEHFFEDEAHESEDAEEEKEDDNDDDDVYDLESTYANVQKVKQRLLNRLRRFEQLAELDPMELERKLLEDDSDDECQRESIESDGNQPLSPYRSQQCVDKYVNQVRGGNLGNREIVWERICSKLINSWNEAEFSTVDRLAELDFRKEFEEWKEFLEQVEEAAGEVALAIYGIMVEELLEELCLPGSISVGL